MQKEQIEIQRGAHRSAAGQYTDPAPSAPGKGLQEGWDESLSDSLQGYGMRPGSGMKES